MFHRAQTDEGFTLSELTVVLALLSVILSVAWLGFRATNAGVQVSDRQAAFSREVGQPLEQMERTLGQVYDISDDYPGPNDYRVQVSTDADRDGQTEHTTFEATADGTLVMKRYEGNSAADEVTFTLSEHNANRSAGIPLFRYYDYAGAELTPGSGYVSSDTFKVKVTVVVEYDGHRFNDSRFVYFRNR